MIQLNKLISNQLVRFMIVGVINTLVGSIVMFGLYNLFDVSYWISTAANYVVGSIVSYILNKHWTFNNKEKSLKIILKFVINIVLCYFIAYGIAQNFTHYFLGTTSIRVQDNVAMFIGLILFTGLNYLGQRYFAFRKSSNSI